MPHNSFPALRLRFSPLHHIPSCGASCSFHTVPPRHPFAGICPKVGNKELATTAEPPGQCRDRCHVRAELPWWGRAPWHTAPVKAALGCRGDPPFPSSSKRTQPRRVPAPRGARFGHHEHEAAGKLSSPARREEPRNSTFLEPRFPAAAGRPAPRSQPCARSRENARGRSRAPGTALSTTAPCSPRPIKPYGTQGCSVAAARRRAHPARAVFTFLLLLPSPSAGLERVQRHALEGGQEELPARRRASNPWPRSSGRDPSARALTRRGSLSPSGRFASSPPPAEAEGSFNLPPGCFHHPLSSCQALEQAAFSPGCPGHRQGCSAPFARTVWTGPSRLQPPGAATLAEIRAPNSPAWRRGLGAGRGHAGARAPREIARVRGTLTQ